MFSVDRRIPLYYRLLPGNIRDVKAFKLTLKESNISDAVIIADKGFYSTNNIKLLKKKNL